jgi:hypothetical protein
MQEAIRSTDGLAIAAGVLERALELEERAQGRPDFASEYALHRLRYS